MNDSNEDQIDPTHYRRLIGSLRYLCHIRPNLAYSVGMKTIFMQNPKVSHLAGFKRMMRYLKGTLDYGILFLAADERNENKLVSYTNSSWYGDVEDRKSTTEYIYVTLCACQSTWKVNIIKDTIGCIFKLLQNCLKTLF